MDDYPNDFDNQLTLQVKGFIQSIMLNGETALASALQKSLSKKEASAHIKSAMLEKAFSEKTPEPNVFSQFVNLMIVGAQRNFLWTTGFL